MHHVNGRLVVLEAARPHQFIFRMELLCGVGYTNTTVSLQTAMESYSKRTYVYVV